MSNERRLVFFSGQVQGVGFRYSARSLARPFCVSGFVRNLADGRVELAVEGEPAEINEFLAAMQSRLGQYIREQQSTTDVATGEFDGFEIRY